MLTFTHFLLSLLAGLVRDQSYEVSFSDRERYHASVVWNMYPSQMHELYALFHMIDFHAMRYIQCTWKHLFSPLARNSTAAFYLEFIFMYNDKKIFMA